MNNLNIKFQNLMKTKYGMAGFFAGLFIVALVGSWVVFSFIAKSGNSGVASGGVNSTRSRINPNLPKTEICPINGQKYTAEEKKIWEGRRPATIMVENNVDARPLNGLSKADFLYEAVTEGGITRFLAVFYCGTAAEDVIAAPVRSSRVAFVNWASEYGDFPLYAHVGGANDYGPNGGSKAAGDIDPRVNALGLLQQLGWDGTGNNFDGGYSAGIDEGFLRRPDRVGHDIAYEHTMTLDLDKLFAAAEKRGFGATHKGNPWTKGFVPYNFIDGAPASSESRQATDIKFDFWSSQPDYSVEWKYDANNNQYLRWNGGQPFTDIQFNNTQVSAKNVVVMMIDETGPVDAEKHMIEDNIGTGKAYVFQNGTVIQGKWAKADRTARTILTDSNGKQISLVRGTTFVEAVPNGNTIDYK